MDKRAMEALEMDRIRAEKFGEDNAEGILLANQADQRKISENKVIKFDDWKSKQGSRDSERTARGSSWERAINAEARNRDLRGSPNQTQLEVEKQDSRQFGSTSASIFPIVKK